MELAFTFYLEYPKLISLLVLLFDPSCLMVLAAKFALERTSFLLEAWITTFRKEI